MKIFFDKLRLGLQDHLEVQVDSIKSGSTYVVLDDMLATGGTLKAACDLLTECGAKVLYSKLLLLLNAYLVMK